MAKISLTPVSTLISHIYKTSNSWCWIVVSVSDVSLLCNLEFVQNSLFFRWTCSCSVICLVFRGPHSTRPQQPLPQSWLQDPDRPSIISATELKELDNLDTDADEGWAGLDLNRINNNLALFIILQYLAYWTTLGGLKFILFKVEILFTNHVLYHSGAQMEVDYTEKLNFSDDEENQAAKDKGENWWVLKSLIFTGSSFFNHPLLFQALLFIFGLCSLFYV